MRWHFFRNQEVGKRKSRDADKTPQIVCANQSFSLHANNHKNSYICAKWLLLQLLTITGSYSDQQINCGRLQLNLNRQVESHNTKFVFPQLCKAVLGVMDPPDVLSDWRACLQRLWLALVHIRQAAPAVPTPSDTCGEGEAAWSSIVRTRPVSSFSPLNMVSHFWAVVFERIWPNLFQINHVKVIPVDGDNDRDEPPRHWDDVIEFEISKKNIKVNR